ncbi:BrnT family toxin [Salinarimonas rosea]|uniref:BrnT family toxin n=1 Tax=Salinarimonas rosea TaxID=552063 RepID=UPI0003F650EB|nr:BrnT family toxin [Salinarimonas rosea]
MEIAFDPAKDATNITKHGISLVRATELELGAWYVDDRRDYGEVRYRAFGWIDGKPYVLAFTWSGVTLRAISLRRARPKEMRKYGL